MSLETWKEEFYPIPADKVKPEDAIQHSLTKWKGLLPENLEKHSVIVFERKLMDKQYNDIQPFIRINSESCSLCELYYDKAPSGNFCSDCPIYKAVSGNCAREYYHYTMLDGNNPQPMIDLLEQTLLHSQKATNEPV